jgi:predicted dehydrogenase
MAQASVVRVGILGAGGGMAGKRAKDFAANSNGKISACASRTIEKARELAGEYGAKAMRDVDEMAASPDVDAVCISTPNMMHFEHAKVCLEHGKHVLVEYPLCQSVEEAETLRALAHAKGVKLHHGMNTRSEPLFAAVRDVLPTLGDVACARMTYYGGKGWYVTPEIVGNLFLALHIHFVDYFRGFFGDVEALTATIHRYGSGDGRMHSGTVLLEMSNCPSAYMEFGMGYPGKPSYEMCIVGTEGRLVKNEVVRLECDEKQCDLVLPELDAVKADSDNFVDEIVKDAPPLREWDDVLQTMKHSLDCGRSADTRSKIFC